MSKQENDYHNLPSKEIQQFTIFLLNWFNKTRRKLPWRGDPPPYSNWIETRNYEINNKQPTIKEFINIKKENDLSKNETKKHSNPSIMINKQQHQLKTEISSKLWENENNRAYAVWISEIMLQQTQVSTVISYWIRWMNRWPTVNSLSEANLEEINEMWAGLGYYSRAKNILLGAQQIINDFDGIIPKDEKSLLLIQGIGKYTAGAILSIAFKKPYCAIDGNVIRVFSRLLALATTSNSQSLYKYLSEILPFWICEDHPGDFNQALMELGATICKPKKPLCSQCPVKTLCKINKEIEDLNYRNSYHFSNQCNICDINIITIDSPECYPIPKERKIKPEQYLISLFLQRWNENKKEILLTKRPSKGLLANQWEPIIIEIDMLSFLKNDTQLIIKKALTKEKINFNKKLGINEHGKIKHIFTHKTFNIIICSAWQVETKKDEDNNISNLNRKWLQLEDIKSLISTSYFKKMFDTFNSNSSTSNSLLENYLTSSNKKKKIIEIE